MSHTPTRLETSSRGDGKDAREGAGLAAQEFAFRYLSTEQARTEPRPLDLLERRFQYPRATFHAQAPDDPVGDDLEPLFRMNFEGCRPQGDLRNRLLRCLLAVHCPATVTPHSAYGLHASYPSPRAYYPLSFLLVSAQTSELHWVDTAQLRLRRTMGPPEEVEANGVASNSYSIHLRVDFAVYDKLYNLFRTSLFLLEAGHFIAELLEQGRGFGLQMQPVIGAAGVRIHVSDTAMQRPANAVHEQRSYARMRHSGRFVHGLYPARHRLRAHERDQLLETICGALRDAGGLFRVATDCALDARLCLRAGDGVSAGVFAVQADGVRSLGDEDQLEACEANYSYRNFTFATLPAALYLTVNMQAFRGTQDGLFELNIALGYVAQRVIHHLTLNGLFGRPFRSYDQLAMDRLLGCEAEGRMTYYGLLIGKNRCQEPVGVLR